MICEFCDFLIVDSVETRGLYLRISGLKWRRRMILRSREYGFVCIEFDGVTIAAWIPLCSKSDFQFSHSPSLIPHTVSRVGLQATLATGSRICRTCMQVSVILQRIRSRKQASFMPIADGNLCMDIHHFSARFRGSIRCPYHTGREINMSFPRAALPRPTIVDMMALQLRLSIA